MDSEEIQTLESVEKVGKEISSRRWAVLTSKYLFTFKEKQVYSRPTERIDLSTCSAPLCADFLLMKPNSIVSGANCSK